MRGKTVQQLGRVMRSHSGFNEAPAECGGKQECLVDVAL